MPRADARFRVSIKDKKSGVALKVELIDALGLWGERRYRIRLNGREPAHVKEATLTEIFERPLDRARGPELVERVASLGRQASRSVNVSWVCA
jgi:hypothetical protein